MMRSAFFSAIALRAIGKVEPSASMAGLARHRVMDCAKAGPAQHERRGLRPAGASARFTWGPHSRTAGAPTRALRHA